LSYKVFNSLKCELDQIDSFSVYIYILIYRYKLGWFIFNTFRIKIQI